jgi:hypothetical protein
MGIAVAGADLCQLALFLAGRIGQPDVTDRLVGFPADEGADASDARPVRRNDRLPEEGQVVDGAVRRDGFSRLCSLNGIRVMSD